MYNNIGTKIKGLAKGIFVVEAISFIIAGISLMAAGDDLILLGLLTMLCGPIVAWVSSWILYAFGELVDTNCENERNTRNILDKLDKIYIEKDNKPTEEKKTVVKKSPATTVSTNETPIENKEERTDTVPFSITEKGTIICPQCNFEQPKNRKCCWHCGAKFENT